MCIQCSSIPYLCYCWINNRIANIYRCESAWCVVLGGKAELFWVGFKVIVLGFWCLGFFFPCIYWSRLYNYKNEVIKKWVRIILICLYGFYYLLNISWYIVGLISVLSYGNMCCLSARDVRKVIFKRIFLEG